MKLNTKKIPKTLDEAIEVLKASLDKKDIEAIKKKDFSMAMVHFSLGMYLRNTWKLWHQTTPIVKWFKKTYALDHADDISGIILECLKNDILKEPRTDKELAERYIQHWKKYNKQ